MLTSEGGRVCYDMCLKMSTRRPDRWVVGARVNATQNACRDELRAYAKMRLRWSWFSFESWRGDLWVDWCVVLAVTRNQWGNCAACMA